MLVINKITTSIVNKRLSLEDKIGYLEALNEKNIDLTNLPKNYISEDKVLVGNVILNIKKYHNIGKMSIAQIIRCENIGITFDDAEKDADYKIDFLMKAKQENYDLHEVIKNNSKYKNNSIYNYIVDLREMYEKDKLDDEQIKKCEDNLKIILLKENRKDIIMKTIKESAIKNLLVSEKI